MALESGIKCEINSFQAALEQQQFLMKLFLDLHSDWGKCWLVPLMLSHYRLFDLYQEPGKLSAFNYFS